MWNFSAAILWTQPDHDGIWLVTFMHYDLGFIDLEQKTLQPLDNPFGPRLLPMS
jgi:hypothetical protein